MNGLPPMRLRSIVRALAKDWFNALYANYRHQ